MKMLCKPWGYFIMNLVIDIGNTSISFCKFKGNKLISNVKLLQDEFKKTKLTSLISFFSEEKISKTIISSVVPNCNSIIKNDLKSKCLKFFFVFSYGFRCMRLKYTFCWRK